MVIYDTKTRKKVPFEPIKARHATIYVCGPTVYDDAHLGHARSALAFDLLRRTLEALGYQVRLAKNFTDIDDKIVQKVHETGKTLQELTAYYIDRYLQEMEALRVLRPHIEPKATRSLQAIVSMIETLIQKGYAYQTPNGDVYFDTSKDPNYGSLSHKLSDETQSRVAHDTHKRNERDFALWKHCKSKEDICFESPFSPGRPGWHIECSAMIEAIFTGDENHTIDIHGGGADLLFPHHENESAQTRCATGREIAKYWMHNGFIRIEGEKMSKSLGNSFFLKDALKVYNGEVLRFYLISIHYRNDFDFNEEDLLASKKRLDKLYRLKKRLLPAAPAKKSDPAFSKALLLAMQDDLNVSKALALIDERIAYGNETLDRNPKEKTLKKTLLADIDLIDRLLGFGGSDPYDYFQHGIDAQTKAKIETLIAQRDTAKAQKDYQTADAIREELLGMGIALMDTPEGTKWEKVE